jgi:hypothetical protein
MKKVGLIGGGFHHAKSTTLSKIPNSFEWSKNNIEDVTFFIDDSIRHGIDIKCKKKIAWLVESRGIIPSAMDFVRKNWKLISENYDCLLTHDKSIESLSDNFYYIPSHGYWIENPKIHKKTKLISMISSNKRMTNGHTYRLNWVEKLKDKVDLFGSGINPINKKEEALNEYMFSVTIENDSYPSYWSEKILDCFVTGTVPIYHGDPNIGDFFNKDGIIILNDDFNLNDLNEDLYHSMMPHIEDNFNRALEYDIIEDIIYKKWIK